MTESNTLPVRNALEHNKSIVSSKDLGGLKSMTLKLKKQDENK